MFGKKKSKKTSLWGNPSKIRKFVMDLGWPIKSASGRVPQVGPGSLLNKDLKPCQEGDPVHQLVVQVASTTNLSGRRIISYSYVQFPIEDEDTKSKSLEIASSSKSFL